MQYETITGAVDRIVRSSSVSGDKKSVTTKHTTSFRVGGRQVEYDNQIDLSDGDQIVVAGYVENSGLFRARAIYNTANGLTNGQGEIGIWEKIGTVIAIPFILFCFLILLGIPVGIAITGWLIIFWRDRLRDRKAFRTLKAHLDAQPA